MLLGVDVAGIINGVFGRDAKAITLTRFTPGTRTPGSLSAGTHPTSTTYSCKGWIESFDDDDIDGTLITKSDRKVTILGRSISVTPTDGDQITIADLDGVSKTFRCIGPASGSGPQGALFICQVRL